MSGISRVGGGASGICCTALASGGRRRVEKAIVCIIKGKGGGRKNLSREKVVCYAELHVSLRHVLHSVFIVSDS